MARTRNPANFNLVKHSPAQDCRSYEPSSIRDNSEEFKEMIGTCPAMHEVFNLIRKVSTTDIPVLVTGASGTGKEMVAQAIHQRSGFEKGPFVVVNCGAIPRELLESELFGHEKGSFTGAYRTMVGKVELANNGTLFLDELGELPLELQVKLLRFLQDYSFERVGGRQKINVNLRVIAATNRDLEESMVEGRFRTDLFYRLDGIRVSLPLLKDRGKDVLIMAKIFLSRYASSLRKKVQGFTPEAVQAIEHHEWPGNVRELINRIRRAVVMTESPWVTPDDLDFKGQSTPTGPFFCRGLKEEKEELEKKLLTGALQSYNGNVQQVASVLKTSRSVVYYLINKYKLSSNVSAIFVGVIVGACIVHFHLV